MERITGVIRDYDWGDHQAIAGILGHEPPGHPEAEYWLGAHPGAPSMLVDQGTTLDRVIATAGAGVVGEAVWQRFKRLPFLLKVLAAGKPLSIQAHPSLVQAKSGFAREEAAGMDRAAPHRNYRDDNHKPELLCAITRFEAKCGFRPLAETIELLALFSDPVITDLRLTLESTNDEQGSLASVVRSILTLAEADARSLIEDVIGAAAALLANTTPEVDRFRPELEWTLRIGRIFPGDAGVVVALLLNHVTLEPGQAMFLAAGNLHCYLKGVAIELMANSDNVVRGGMTSKHVDVSELLKVVDYRAEPPPLQSASGSVHRYESPVPEFSLTRLNDFHEACFAVEGPEIILATGGLVEIRTSSRSIMLRGGEAVFVCPEDVAYRLVDQAPGSTLVWRAATGYLGQRPQR